MKNNRVTFQEFNKRSNRIANSLKNKGYEKGTVIGILSWNRMEYADVYGAAMKGGYILAHLNPRLSSQELKYVINDSRSRVLFLEKDFIPLIQGIRNELETLGRVIVFDDAPDDMIGYDQFLTGNPDEEPGTGIREDDPVAIVYTSGTTGIPRGALYTQGQKMDSTVYKALDIGAQAQGPTPAYPADVPYRRGQPHLAVFYHRRLQCHCPVTFFQTGIDFIHD